MYSLVTTSSGRTVDACRVLLLAALFGLMPATVSMAQTAPTTRPARTAQTAEGPWFGVRLPPKMGQVPAVVVGDRGVRPVTVPAGEQQHRELEGAAIRADLETIVGFAKESRTTREIGSGQLWGRIAGFPSATKTVEWSVAQFRRAGIADVKLQPITQEKGASFWLPLAWEVRLLADPAFGPGSADVVLESAMPLGPSELPTGTMTAPLIYVGAASPAVLEHIDVKGKIAVQLVIPQGHMVFERGPVVSRAQDLMKRGAVAVFNIMRQPGNEHAKDFSNCGGPCFNLGGRDGFFLESVLDRASQSPARGKLRAQITLKTESRSNLKAENGVATIPGRRTDETIIVNAHIDGWFDGAGDNADGLAVLLALARHFAKAEIRPERTLVFIASAGHHSPGLNGPRNFIAMNGESAKKAVIVINLEHVAQRNFSPSREVADDGYREAIADSGEAPIVAGVTNRSPFVNNLFQQGVARYGVNFVSDKSAMASGETGGFTPLNVARLTIMQAPPLYHTTGEVLDVISTPGLERMARFFAFFIKEVGKAPRTQINP